MEQWRLERDWEFKQSDQAEWLPVDRVPTNIHLDLIENKMCEESACADMKTANSRT